MCVFGCWGGGWERLPVMRRVIFVVGAVACAYVCRVRIGVCVRVSCAHVCVYLRACACFWRSGGVACATVVEWSTTSELLLSTNYAHGVGMRHHQTSPTQHPPDCAQQHADLAVVQATRRGCGRGSVCPLSPRRSSAQPI